MGVGGVASTSYATNEWWADCPQRQVNAGDGSRAAAVPRDGRLAMASKGDSAQLLPWPLLHLAACDASKESDKNAQALIRTAAVSVLQGGRDGRSLKGATGSNGVPIYILAPQTNRLTVSSVFTTGRSAGMSYSYVSGPTPFPVPNNPCSFCRHNHHERRNITQIAIRPTSQPDSQPN